MGDPSYDAQTALVVVDVQNDLAHPDGGLYVRGGENLVPTITAPVGGRWTPRSAKASPYRLRASP
jgi:hypothetical protein